VKRLGLGSGIREFGVRCPQVWCSLLDNPKLETQKFETVFTMADPKILELFPNPAPHRDYVIAHTQHEFTSMCPITGHPDFAVITVKFTPDKTCVELKSLKLYLHAFRNEGIFFEAVTNKICDDIGAALKPRALTIIADWKGRGGISSLVTCEWSAKQAKKR
jgi:7-cyano-7-deazaguanine reductase